LFEPDLQRLSELKPQIDMQDADFYFAWFEPVEHIERPIGLTLR
jgi:hypothetical protein